MSLATASRALNGSTRTAAEGMSGRVAMNPHDATDSTAVSSLSVGPTTVVFAPDSFKGSITAADAALALADGWRTIDPTIQAVMRPMADGGEGTLAAFATAMPASRRMPITVTGPDGDPRRAEWLLLEPTSDAPQGTGVVELASTSGIELLGERRLPFSADTTGFGQAIAAAIAHGVSKLVLGIGSSCSTDGGTGLLRALGARFMDADGCETPPGARGLAAITTADLSGLLSLPAGGVRVLSDVTNPLTGPLGAAAAFGPQKGLRDQDDIVSVDAGLSHLADLVGGDAEAPGAGAAGGAGFGLSVWGAQLVPGASAVAELIGLRAAFVGATCVVTGEGAFDGQSAAGKVPAFVSHLAAEMDISVMLVAGRIAPETNTDEFRRVVSLTDLANSPDAAMATPERWLHGAGALLARSVAAGQR